MMHKKYAKKYISRNPALNFFSNLSIVGWLILANFIFFFIVLVFVAIDPSFFDYIALKPSNILQGKYIWTILTSMFMHAPGIIPLLSFHLFINMFVLFSLGSSMEKIIGRKRFFWFYLISGIVAGLTFVLLAGFFGSRGLGTKIFGDAEIPAIGASGAIFAIAGLFVVLLPRIRFAIIFFPFFSLPGYVMVPLVLILTWVVSSASGLPIGNAAHLGGFVTGLVYGLYLRQKYKRKVAMLNKMFK
jgi:membrane associated rhomboid family serine protease